MRGGAGRLTGQHMRICMGGLHIATTEAVHGLAVLMTLPHYTCSRKVTSSLSAEASARVAWRS